MKPETLIEELVKLGETQFNAECQVAYMLIILYQWELRDYLANRENGMCHVRAYDTVLKNRANQNFCIVTSGWQ